MEDLVASFRRMTLDGLKYLSLLEIEFELVLGLEDPASRWSGGPRGNRLES